MSAEKGLTPLSEMAKLIKPIDISWLIISVLNSDEFVDANDIQNFHQTLQCLLSGS